jgi:hypothetical protein
MPSFVELLTVAQQNKLVVTVIYNGGSNPGIPRPLIPVRILSDAVFARVPGLGQEKTFKLDKIAKVATKSWARLSGLQTAIHPSVASPAGATTQGKRVAQHALVGPG